MNVPSTSERGPALTTRALATGGPAHDRRGATRGLLQIGEVAERTGLSLRTVRHYEEVGLLAVAERSPGGFRLYTDEAVTRLLVIKQMKPCDFTLGEMREVLGILDELEDPGLSPDRRRELHATLADVRLAVAKAMRKMRERLRGAEDFVTALDELLTTR